MGKSEFRTEHLHPLQLLLHLILHSLQLALDLIFQLLFLLKAHFFHLLPQCRHRRGKEDVKDPICTGSTAKLYVRLQWKTSSRNRKTSMKTRYSATRCNRQERLLGHHALTKPKRLGLRSRLSNFCTRLFISDRTLLRSSIGGSLRRTRKMLQSSILSSQSLPP